MSNGPLDKNADAVRKRLAAHRFEGETGEEYGASRFGDFGDYFRRKKLKLHNEDVLRRQAVPGKPQIFKDIVAHVASYTQPAPEELHRLLVLHGAVFVKYLDYKTMVTHIVASTLPPKKADEWRRLRVVRPAWVVDSVAAGRLLPWTDYRLIGSGPGQKRIHFGHGGALAVADASPDPMTGYREQSKSSHYAASMGRLAAAHDRTDATTSGIVRHLPSVSVKEEGDEGEEVERAGGGFAGLHGFDQRTSSATMLDADVSDDVQEVAKGDSHFHVDMDGLKDMDDVDDMDDIDDMDGIDDTDDADDADAVGMDGLRGLDVVDGTDSRELPAGQGLARMTSTGERPPWHGDTDADTYAGADADADSATATIAAAAVVAAPPPLTSEEHNARLLADPKIREASAANPDFLQKFYAESRLHHLSTWRAEIKAKMQRLAAARATQGAQGAQGAQGGQEGRGTRRTRTGSTGGRRYILHVDFDCFFCAVSLKSQPAAYAAQPAAVAHSTGRASEIASCNYPARRLGVRNGMWMGRALALCPDLRVLPYDFAAYEAASRQFYEAVLDMGGVVQSVSVDEALVDVTRLVGGDSDNNDNSDNNDSDENDENDENDKDDDARIAREQAAADGLATALRRRVREQTGCDVSVGIGGNILVARVALRRAKPAGQHQIRPAEVLGVLGALPVAELPGVAHSIGGRLAALDVQRVADLRAVSRARLTAALGPRTAARLHAYARGIDETAVVGVGVGGGGSGSGSSTTVAGAAVEPRRSVSAEVNWGIRFVSAAEAEAFVRALADELARRLRRAHVRGRRLTLRVLRRAADAPLDPEKTLGHGRCDALSRSTAFGVATLDAAALGREAVALLRALHVSPGDLRGLGVQMQKLEPLRAAEVAAGADGDAQGAAATATASSQTTLPFAPASPSSRQGAAKTDPSPPPPPPPPPPSRQSIFSTAMAPPPVFSRRDGSRSVGGHASAAAHGQDDDTTAPVALASTQFMMPANPDPSVLAELPPDILRRLVGQPAAGRAENEARLRDGRGGASGRSSSNSGSRQPSPEKRQRPEMAARSTATPRLTDMNALPVGIDREVFAALPEDMQAEVLAEYGRGGGGNANSISGNNSSNSNTNNTRQLSNSPASSPRRNKTRPAKATAASTAAGSRKAAAGHSPVKRGIWGTRGLAAAAAARERLHDARAGRVQTSICLPMATRDGGRGEDAPDELDPEVLAALPADVRAEVLEDDRRRRQAWREAQSATGPGTGPAQALRIAMPRRGPEAGAGAGGVGAVGTSTTGRGGREDGDAADSCWSAPTPAAPAADRGPVVVFPAPPPKMPFRMAQADGAAVALSLGEAKSMLRTWHAATRTEGPHEGDVAMLERYVGGVVVQERDMDKARKLVAWLAWLVEDEDEDEGEGGNDVDGADAEVAARTGRQRWQLALARVRQAVQTAMRARGLGRMEM